MNRWTRMGWVIGIGALVGCAAIPPEQKTPQALEVNQISVTSEIAHAPVGSWPQKTWWDQFSDPQLDQLVQRAIANNPQLAAVEERVAAARGLAKIRGSATLPTVVGEASSELTRFSHDSYIPPDINGHDLFGGPVWMNDIGVGAAYHLDLWGADRAALHASLDAVKASQYDAESARLALEGAVLGSYARLSYAYEVQDNEAAILQDEEQTVSVVERRLAAGLGTELELQQAQSAVAATRAQLAQVSDRISLTRHQIAVLCGSGPGSTERLERPTLTVSMPVSLPSHIPAELLGHRPDVLAELSRIESAHQEITVAKAAYYPNVDLKAMVGLVGIGFGQLVSRNAINASAGPAITLPIFEGGRLDGALDVRRAQYAAAVDAYNATVLQAMREVADQLSSFDSLQAVRQHREERLAYAQRARELAQIAFRSGLTDYLNVLTTQNDLNKARNELAEVGLQQTLTVVALQQALGGGMEQ